MPRDSMVFYRSFYEAVKELDAEDFKKAVISILGYAMDDVNPDITGISKAMFLMAKPQIDANNKRYLNGCKSGKNVTKVEPKSNQSRTKAEPKRNQNVTKVDPNENDNENDNENEKIKESVKKSRGFSPPTVEEVRAYSDEKGYQIDYERFVDFYECKGWMVGKNKMKDWKAAVRTWYKNDVKEQKGVHPVNSKIHDFGERQYDFDKLLEEIK